MYSQLSWNCIDQAGLKIREPGLTSTLNLDLVAQSSLSLWIGNPSQNSHNSCLLVSLVFYGNVCVCVCGGGVVTYTRANPEVYCVWKGNLQWGFCIYIPFYMASFTAPPLTPNKTAQLFFLPSLGWQSFPQALSSFSRCLDQLPPSSLSLVVVASVFEAGKHVLK